MRRFRPVIGVTTSAGRGRFMWWFNRFALWRAGARARRLEPHRRVDLTQFQGLVLGGGDNIDARIYGGQISPIVGIDPDRDALELELLKTAKTENLPVLGICRGAQMINIALGGALYADIYDTYEDLPRMRTPLPRKAIRLAPGSHLQRIVGKRRDRVNALHRQAVSRLGEGVRVAARDQYGMVQAIEVPAYRFLLGVQWHPEFMVFDRGQQHLYAALVSAARHWAETGSEPETRETAAPRSHASPDPFARQVE